MRRHEERQRLALEFGATDIVSERGKQAIERVLELTKQEILVEWAQLSSKGKNLTKSI